MKKIAFIIKLLFLCGQIHSQYTFKNTGNVRVNGGTFLVLHNTDFTNKAGFDASGATLSFTGSSSNALKSGGSTIHNLVIGKSGGQTVRLLDDTGITNQLEFIADGNTLALGTADLTMGAAATIIGASEHRFIVTDNTGRLIKSNLSAYTFPVGFDASSYNPISLIENGTADNVGVRCLENVLDEGASGNPVLSAVANVSWELSEDILGGSELSVTAQWNASDELTSFSHTDCGLMRYHDGDWDLPVTAMNTAAGTDPYTQTGTVRDLGVIAVGGESLINRVQLAVRAFLQGPFAGTQMTDHLRAKDLIPLTEPFTALGYEHQGRGGGETIEPTVLDITGEDAVTDWVVIELRDKNNAAIVLETVSALIQRDGDIVGLDGVSDVGLPVVDDDYFVAIRHRNHLGIRTPLVEHLQEAGTAIYDFTTNPTHAYGINPMTEVGDGIWAMWGGNTTGDNSVRATGPPAINDYSNLLHYLDGTTNIQSDVYIPQDINMDGILRATGPPTINDYAKLLNFLGGAVNIISEQF